MHQDKNNIDATGYDSIQFRAFLDNFSDDFNASHNEIKYNGRGESFYTYNKFSRKINISFKIGAQSVHEMKPLYQKLNYLAAQTAPAYSNKSARIMTPYMRVTLGDYLIRVPGILTNVGIQWQKDYPWEINDEKSSYLKKLPHILDVSVSFTPIHDFTPNNDFQSSPFISIGGKDSLNPDVSNWLKYSPKDAQFINKYGQAVVTSTDQNLVRDSEGEELQNGVMVGAGEHNLDHTGRLIFTDSDGLILQNLVWH